MGWISYKLKRTKTNTGETLGDIVVFFPKVSKITILQKRDNLTIADLLSIPDFPIESTVFAPGTSNDIYVEKLKNFGFGNAIALEDYLGETWILDNGSYMTFQKSTSSGTAHTVRYFNSNGTQLSHGSQVDTRDIPYTFEFDFPIFLFGDDEETFTVEWGYRLKFYSPPDVANTVLPVGLVEKFPYYEPTPLNFFKGATPIVESIDPYNPGGETEPGGGTGDFNNTGDNISIPELPSLSAVDGGFITIFTPSLAELKNLSSYMWSNLFDVDGWKKIFADPMNAILGLSIVPVTIPSTSTHDVTVGNISTGVYMSVADRQYITVDCGTLNVNEYWGGYLDYAPYTKAEIYLPYVGTHAVSTDDIMGKSVHVMYNIDILSGACCAYIQCGNSVLYSFSGQCACSIPITGDNWNSVINGAISIAGSIGSMVASGGATAPMAIGNIAATAVNTLKPTVEKSGSLSGVSGLLGVQKPYLILTRPRQALPANQNSYIGYPSYITRMLNDLTGYTEIDSIHLENVPATDSELTEIESILKSGVIF